jgi:hypothetical protein
MADVATVKARAFEMWREGKSLQEIETGLGEGWAPGADQLREWVADWTRGAQAAWAPDLSAPHRSGQPLLRELAFASDVFVSRYSLWLIAARIALWTRQPAELQHAHELMRQSEEHLRRIHAFFGRHDAEFPEDVRVVLRELVRVASFQDVQPTAEIFNRQMDDVGQLGRQLKHAIEQALA